MANMKAVVFKKKNTLAVEEVPKPVPGPGEAVIKITATIICGTDVHVVRGEYPVRPGLILGHEPVGVIEELGHGLDRIYRVGERVIAAAITPCGQCFYCLNRFALDDISEAFELFSHQRDGVLKVALYPDGARLKRRANAQEHAVHP
jgi:threonine dehydrogenase-like Zn-dependent dehydrogenase